MRKLWSLILSLTLLGCSLPIWAAVPAGADSEPVLSASAAILLDADSGTVLYEKNADARALIASTTKIMTGLLACERCDPEDEISVPAEAAGIEGSSIYLAAGERVSVRTLLYGTLLQSGNDAAMALAFAACGSEAAFVEQMNERAMSLGLRDTHFANPHGLDSPENYSTARELAYLACAALENPLFAEIVATKTANFGARCFVNHNKLLWRLEGAVGVKTGYTKAAGRLLVSAVRRDGRMLVAVTVNAPDDWNDHAALYAYGLSRYAVRTLATAGLPVCSVAAVGSVKRVELLAKEDLALLCLPQEQIRYVYRGAQLLFPPFRRGADAGTVHVYVDGRHVADLPVCFGATVLQ